MAYNDAAVLTAATGYVYVGAVDTASPLPSALAALDLTDPSAWTATGWSDLGHTSRGDLPEFGSDGGDSEVKGTWQNEKLRNVVSETAVDYVTVVLNQFDEEALALYYGDNTSAVAGIFGVSSSTDADIERALFMVIQDGDVNLGFWAPKASITRDDSITLAVDEFSALPIKATFLSSGSLDLFQWINEDLFNPGS